jgi:hypothetical protein
MRCVKQHCICLATLSISASSHCIGRACAESSPLIDLSDAGVAHHVDFSSFLPGYIMMPLFNESPSLFQTMHRYPPKTSSISRSITTGSGNRIPDKTWTGSKHYGSWSYTVSNLIFFLYIPNLPGATAGPIILCPVTSDFQHLWQVRNRNVGQSLTDSTDASIRVMLFPRF